MDYVQEYSITARNVDKEQVKRDVREAVELLHSEHLVHGDTRIMNILITEDSAMVVDLD